MVLTVRAWRRRELAPPWRAHFGMMLAGWGAFNLVEGLIDHQLLGIHYVRDDLGGPLCWDLAFLGFGVLLVVGGLALEEKLAEVIGLAMAAQGATEKIGALTDDGELSEKLEQMNEEARVTEKRGTELAGGLDGKKTAVLEKASETKSEATEMMSTYLGDDADALDGFEFLTMAEAGEVGHWSVLRKLNEQAEDQRLQELIDWALPIQERHFEDVKAGSLKLAGLEDPADTA
jgi:hypothetical protein